MEKLFKCKVLKSFKDSQNNNREVICDSEFICSEERANKLSLLRYVKVLGEVANDENEILTPEGTELTNPEENKDLTSEGNKIETTSITNKEKIKNAKK